MAEYRAPVYPHRTGPQPLLTKSLTRIRLIVMKSAMLYLKNQIVSSNSAQGLGVELRPWVPDLGYFFLYSKAYLA